MDGNESASAPADAAASDAERDISMALCAALLGTLMLGSIVGVESHWELLALLALIAGLALILDGAALNWVKGASPKRGRR